MSRLGEYSETPEQQCRHLYDALNAISVDALPAVTDMQRHAHRLSLAQGTASKDDTLIGNVQWPPGARSQIPLRIPTLLQPEELKKSSVTDLLRRFKGGLLSAFHALLNHERVVFLGHSQPADTVCLSVLSAPLLVCPPMWHILERCFPYTTLNNLDFLQTDGFIAGTTNPIFESHPEWWDVLCDLDTGKVLLSATGANGRKCSIDPPRLSDVDEEFYEQVLSGLEARYSEYWLRARFQEHAQQILCARRRGSAALIVKRDADAPPFEAIAQYLEQLRSGTRMTDKEMMHILSGLVSFVADDERLCQLLSLLHGSSPLGCISPIAGALLHPNVTVRSQAASLLRSIESNKEAASCVTGLNGFLLSALARN